MQLSQAYGGFRPTFHTGEPRLRIQECAVSPHVRTLRDVLLAEEGRHVPLDGRFELLLRHRTRRPARRNARIPDKFRNAPMRDRNVAALTAIDRRTRLVYPPSPSAFKTHPCPASEPLLARGFLRKKITAEPGNFFAGINSNDRNSRPGTKGRNAALAGQDPMDREDSTKGVANEKLLDSRAVCDHHFSPSRCNASCRSSRRARRAERHRARND
jgi:hypothetical protein